MKAILLTVVLIAGVVSSAQGCSDHSSQYRRATSCNQYYQCSGGKWALQTCPGTLQWNAQGQYCDWPASSGCSGSGEGDPEPEPSTTTTTTTTTTERPTRTTSSSTQTPTTPTTTTTTTTTPAPEGALISLAEFNAASATKGGNPDVSYYNGFIASLAKASITTRHEAILFLSHLIWESVGFIYTKEVYCQTNLQACRNAYPSHHGGRPDKVYYGRGSIQLTWDYNYKSASFYLFNDDRLIQDPDLVSDVPAINFGSSAWYWHANVHDFATSFGATLKAINGALECYGGSHAQNRIYRFNHYKEILSILGVPHPPDSDAWCVAW